MAQTFNVHGTAVAIEGLGVLIQGPSGAGKSLLALDLLDHAAMRGLSAALIGDDRVVLRETGHSLLMSAPEHMAGMIEMRGRGIVTRPFVGDVALALIVDLVDQTIRLPEAHAFTTTLAGLTFARCPVPQRTQCDPVHQRLLVMEALAPLMNAP